MRLLIFGLHPSQQNAVTKKYPLLDIRFQEWGVGSLEARTNADRLIVMKHATNHSITDTLKKTESTRKKLVLVDGSVSSLIRILDPIQVEISEKLKAAATVDKFVHSVKKEEATKMVAPQDIKVDWTALQKAVVGDVLTFPRPLNISNKDWDVRLAAVKRYYKNKRGMLLTFNKKDTVVEILVEKILGQDIKEEQHVPIDEGTPTKKTPAVSFGTDISDIIGSEPKQLAVTNTQLWSAVIISSMKNGNSAGVAIKEADLITSEFRSRFE